MPSPQTPQAVFPIKICEDCPRDLTDDYPTPHPGTNAGCIGCDKTPEPCQVRSDLGTMPAAAQHGFSFIETPPPGTFLPEKTLAVVLAPGGMLHYSLQCWLIEIGVNRIEWQTKFYRDRDDAHNGLIIDHALADRNKWVEQFIFAECDLRPNKHQTNPFLDLLDGDVRCVEYQTEAGPELAWDSQSAFHAGLWWIKRETLLSIRPPWFFLRKSPNGCKTKGCICGSFQKKVLDAGFRIRHGGNAGHTPRLSRCHPIGESPRDLI